MSSCIQESGGYSRGGESDNTYFTDGSTVLTEVRWDACLRLSTGGPTDFSLSGSCREASATDQYILERANDPSPTNPVPACYISVTFVAVSVGREARWLTTFFIILIECR